MQRTVIIDALKRTDFGSEINVRGWVRSRRGNKNVSFIALNDGSTIKNIQIVADLEKFSEEQLKPVTTGSCISATGILVESQGAGQAVEIQLTELEVYGTADPEKYPLQKKGLSMEFLRTVAHLRPRTNTFGAIFRIRHNMAMAIHTYFHEHGYFYFCASAAFDGTHKFAVTYGEHMKNAREFQRELTRRRREKSTCET